MRLQVPSLKTWNLIKLSLYLTQHGESIFKIVLLICISEDHRRPAFRLAATTLCGSDSTVGASFVLFKSRLPPIVLSFIAM